MSPRSPEEIFNDGLDLEPDQRIKYLDEVCSDNPALRAEVESLLAIHSEHPPGDLPSVLREKPRDQIGRYPTLGELGEGGMGKVYRARDPKLEREIAIKVLPRRFVMSPSRFARFKREAQILARLNHPSISTLYSLEESEEGPFLTLELVLGETLAEMLKHSPMSIDQTVSICRAIAEALEAAHRLGVVHRDLKPSNVKVTPEGRVKVLDFGLAKVAIQSPSVGSESEQASMTAAREANGRDPDPSISFARDPSEDGGAASSPAPGSDSDETRLGSILGSPGYMSPEQLRGDEAGLATDLWSLGCIAYECLAGSPAFPGATAKERMTAGLRASPDWTALPDTTPSVLRDLLRECLEKDVEARPASASEVVRLLGRVGAGLPQDAVPQARVPASLGSPGVIPGQTTVGPAGGGFRRRLLKTRGAVAGLVSLGLAAIGPIVWKLATMSEPGVEASERSYRQITYSGEVEQFDISPDGNQLVYVEKNGRLLVRDLGTDLEREPFPGTTAVQPRWSPDGTEVLFYQVHQETRRTFIGTIGDSFPVPIGPELFQGEDWSPDGGTIVGRIADPYRESSTVAYVDRTTGSATLLELGQLRIRAKIDWYPGERPILRGLLNGIDGAWMISKDGKRVDPLLSENRSLFWSPNGRDILASERGDGGSTLSLCRWNAKANAEGSDQFSVLATFDGFERLALARDRVVLRASTGLMTLWWLERVGDVWERRKLMTGTHVMWHPQISPDRKSIVVVTGKADANDLVLIDVETHRQSQLTSFEASFYWPAWSPSGDSIAFGRREPEDKSVWLLDVQTGKSHRLVGTTGSEYVYWRPSERIRYQREAELFQNYVWLDPVSGEESLVLLGDFGGTAFHSAISPDGSLLAIAGVRGGLHEVRPWVLGLADGTERLLYDAKAVPIVWSADNRWVYLVLETPLPEIRGLTSAKVIRVPAEGGEAQPVIDLPPGDLGPWSDVDMTPDGSVVVCIIREAISDLWLAEGLDLELN